ncbi:MAG: HAMP domain-containing sensor histidine kinase [Micropepsaceae bacterium]
MKPGIFSSLRARLVLGGVIWIAIGVTIAGVFIAALFREHATQLFEADMRGHLDELAMLIDVEPGGNPRIFRQSSDPRFNALNSGLAWQVSRDGEILIKSTSQGNNSLLISMAALPDGVVRSQILEGPRGAMTVYERMLSIVGAAPMRLQVAADVAILETLLTSFNFALAVSLALLAVALMAAASLQVVGGLRPMSRLRKALAAIKSGREAHLPRDFPSEVQPLIDDLNSMIDLNKQMVQRARAQAGNLAHGLKTPLAVLTDEADRMAARGETREAETIAQQCLRMRRQIDYQIARARAAASRSMPGVAAKVEKTVSNIVSAMKRLHADKELLFSFAVDRNCIALCDPMDLNEMLANLIDNACKWAKREVVITGAVDAATNTTLIAVEDDGPGLPPESLDVVFQIGERLDERVPGSGLGLPIVRDLAQLYGGAIHLEASDKGGLKAILALPSAG